MKTQKQWSIICELCQESQYGVTLTLYFNHSMKKSVCSFIYQLTYKVYETNLKQNLRKKILILAVGLPLLVLIWGDWNRWRTCLFYDPHSPPLCWPAGKISRFCTTPLLT